jgi:hypothetical protein
MANHNLNIEITLAGTSLVPNTALLNVTNNVTGFGSLGLMANDCAGEALPSSPDPHQSPALMVKQKHGHNRRISY